MPEEYGRIINSGSKVWGGRVDGCLNLTRAFGDLRFKQNKSLPPEKQAITANPDVFSVDISSQKYEFMLMGCDGIFEKYPNRILIESIREEIHKQKKAGKVDP